MATLELRRQDLKHLELAVLARESSALADTAASTRNPSVIKSLARAFRDSLAAAPEWRMHGAQA